MNRSYLTDTFSVFRWIVPGWVAVLSFILFVSIDIILGSLPRKLIEAALNNSSLVAFIVAISGVPIGFIIYQIYFFLRWNSPISSYGLFPPFSTGRAIDVRHVLAGNKAKRQIFNTPLSYRWYKNFYSDENKVTKRARYFDEVWRHIESYYTFCVASCAPNASLIIHRYRYIHDIMHTLGASVIAVLIGFACYFIVKIAAYSKDNIFIGSYVIELFILLFAILILSEYEEKWRDAITFTRKPSDHFFALGTTMLVLLAMSHVILNPQISKFPKTTISHVLLLIPTFFGIIVLVRSIPIAKSRHITTIILITSLVLFMIISMFGAHAINVIHQLWNNSRYYTFDWGYFTNVSIMVSCIYILTKNRANARRDLLYMIHYLLTQCTSLENECTQIKENKEEA